MQGPSHRIISPSIKQEPDIEVIIKGNKIGRLALDTIYDLVWEFEFKNILNVGRVWLKFKEGTYPLEYL
jgi:hypothetical protein